MPKIIFFIRAWLSLSLSLTRTRTFSCPAMLFEANNDWVLLALKNNLPYKVQLDITYRVDIIQYLIYDCNFPYFIIAIYSTSTNSLIRWSLVKRNLMLDNIDCLLSNEKLVLLGDSNVPLIEW